MLKLDDRCERWARIPPTPYGKQHGLHHETSGNLLFGALTTAEGAAPLRDWADDAYARVFSLMDELGYPHALRFWNYLPRLNEHEDGLERYRAFNVGRHAAFERAGRLGAASIPAACALGAREEIRSLYFLAAREPGRPIENPRQVNAWRYPRAYGPVSPTFARALAWPAEGAEMLLVSGTASIVGHETLHVGDVVAQTRETLANLEAVFAEAGRHADFAMERGQYQVYVRRTGDIPAVRGELQARLGANADVAFLTADICRADLLVEVEAFCRAGRGP